MGTYLWSYAVNLDRLGAVFGSKDKRLAKRTIENADADDNAEWFADQIAKGAPRLEQAIEEIIDGKLTKKKHAFQYVYAVERLCSELGTRAGDEFKVGEWIAKVLDPQLKKVKAKDFCRLMHLHAPAVPIAIPKLDDIPFCSSMTLEEVNVAIGAFARLEMRMKAEPPKPDVLETITFAIVEMRSRLRSATRRRCGLVHFMY